MQPLLRVEDFYCFPPYRGGPLRWFLLVRWGCLGAARPLCVALTLLRAGSSIGGSI